jgi:uncharacterized protein (DUF983 family)
VWAANCLATRVPPDKVEVCLPCGMGDRARQCPACRSPKVVVTFSTVAADYLACKACDHTWSMARMASSPAFRISKIVGLFRSAS